MVRSLFKKGEGSPTSKMPLGDGLESLEEGVESKKETVNTTIIEMAIQADNVPLLEI